MTWPNKMTAVMTALADLKKNKMFIHLIQY